MLIDPSRRALLGVGLLLAAGPARAQGYRVRNLMPEYWAFHARAEGLAPQAQAHLFRREVAERHPQVYTARVIGLPPDVPYQDALARRYLRVHEMLAGRHAVMRKVSDAIAADLPRYESRFREVFPDLDFRGDVYFMHSLGGFDGATRIVDGQLALLFGVDMIAHVYGGEIDPQPFFHHELFHVYHAQFVPERDAEPFLVALWREGLATYVAQKLNPAAQGVSIFGLPPSTPGRVNAALSLHARTVRGLLDSRDREDLARWFTGVRETGEVPARAGYVLGFRIAERLGRQRGLRDLARASIGSLRADIEQALVEFASGR